MRAVKSVTIDSERRVIITFLDGSTETLYPNLICCDAEALRDIIKELLEEKADAIVQTINNVTIASFADGADEALIKKLLVSIDPIQEGSGDPSPENVRPIRGRTGLSVVRTGKNLLGGAGMIENAKAIKEATGASRPIIDETANTIIFNAAQDAGRQLFTPILKENTVYTLIFTFSKIGTNRSSNIQIRYTDNSAAWVLPLPDNVAYGEKGTVLFTSASGKTIKDIAIGNQGGTTTIYCNESGIFEGVLTSDDFEPYKGSTYSVNWETEAGTVYGGYVDVVSGKLVVDSAYIASYNGEVLPSTWISDRDVYVEGATPIMGAQVVYKLAEPIEYQLEPQEITTLLGTNNIWADSGDILELEYVADTKLYIGESQSGTLGSGRQTNSNTDLQPVSEKTWEELSEAYKAETEEKETQEETKLERGE